MYKTLVVWRLSTRAHPLTPLCTRRCGVVYFVPLGLQRIKKKEKKKKKKKPFSTVEFGFRAGVLRTRQGRERERGGRRNVRVLEDTFWMFIPASKSRTSRYHFSTHPRPEIEFRFATRSARVSCTGRHAKKNTRIGPLDRYHHSGFPAHSFLRFLFLFRSILLLNDALLLPLFFR